MFSHHERRVIKSINSHMLVNEKSGLPKKMVVRSAEQAILEKVNQMAISTKLSVNEDYQPPPKTTEPVKNACTQKVCAVCQLETPALTRVKINAVTKCKHIFCYECALRLLFISVPNQPKGAGITCPICRSHTDKVFLTVRQFTDDEQEVKDFVDHWWPLLETSDSRVCVFGDACFPKAEQEDIMPHIDTLMVLRCAHCYWTQNYICGIFRRNYSDFKNLAAHL